MSSELRTGFGFSGWPGKMFCVLLVRALGAAMPLVLRAGMHELSVRSLAAGPPPRLGRRLRSKAAYTTNAWGERVITSVP